MYKICCSLPGNRFLPFHIQLDQITILQHSSTGKERIFMKEALVVVNQPEG